MKTFFIEEKTKTGIIGIFKTVKKIDDKIIIYKNLEKCNLNNKIKIIKKIKRILDIENVKQVAVEKRIKNDEQFINLINSCNTNICNSKWILKKCTDRVIDTILKKKKKEESEINICVNEVDSLTEEYIYMFSKQFKKVNIITNHIEKFKKLEENIYQEEGILINLSNNRRKSLLKAEIIINVDFPKELINEYVIFEKCQIINWSEPLKINKKRFNGKIIEEITILFEKDSRLSNVIEEKDLRLFDERDICQAFEIIPEGKICFN